MGAMKAMATRISDNEYLARALKNTVVEELDAEHVELNTENLAPSSQCSDCLDYVYGQPCCLDSKLGLT